MQGGVALGKTQARMFKDRRRDRSDFGGGRQKIAGEAAFDQKIGDIDEAVQRQ
jgi:hypothetical protein